MSRETQIVLSASRRTDIPAFYMSWFMEQIQKGFFEITNPYNRKVSIVQATPERVNTIVFWSKNFNQFLHNNDGEKLQAMGYNLFFNFTINSHDRLLEPHVPPLADRLAQLTELGKRFGAQIINWRFDPICFYKNQGGKILNNLGDFSLIAGQAGDCGIKRCITSFMDNYHKIQKRVSALKGFYFIDPPLEKKITFLLKMEQHLAQLQISLFTCCEKSLTAQLPEESTILPSACIPNDFLMELYGGKLSLRKDSGQRINSGCTCRISIDIGVYHLHPCFHNCLFCYANPVAPESGQFKTALTECRQNEYRPH